VPDALTLWSLAVLVIGGLMYVAMSMSTRSSPSSSTSMGVRRPGWITRRRARGGITHRRDRVGVGYASATKAVHLTVRELAGHGLTVGGPGSGKTTFLQLLVEAAAGETPVVIVDPKGSPALEATVRAHGGQVWTIDGKLPADLLDPRPHQVPDLLLEAEDYSPGARVFRDAAHQRALWAAWALALRGEPMDLARLRRLLDREALLKALDPYRRDPRVSEWVDRLEHQRGGVEDSGARGLDRALGILLDGPAMLGSLRSCPESLRLEDVLDTNGLVLFKLDAAEYPHATRKVASWVLLGMGRLARQLPDMQPRPEHIGLGNVVRVERAVPGGSPRALLLVDEVGALGSAARHLRGLVGRARESGLAVVLATQGPSDLEAVDRSLLPQVLQDTAWQLAFRQGSPQDAERMQALFGKAWVNDESWSSDGRTTTRRVERPRVSIDEWMNALEPGDAWLRVAPVDRGWRQERVRVALPTRKMDSENTSENASETNGSQFGRPVKPNFNSDNVVVGRPAREPLPAGERGLPPEHRDKPLPPPPPTCPTALIERIGADILAKVDERWASPRRELGPCLMWREGEPVIRAAGCVYGRIYDPAIKRSDAAHLGRVAALLPGQADPEGIDGRPPLLRDAVPATGPPAGTRHARRQYAPAPPAAARAHAAGAGA
jgi:hypothetical protein